MRYKNGLFQLIHKEDGTYLKLYPPVTGGAPVDINDIMAFVRAIEYDTTSQNITELFEFIRDENKDLKG